MIKTNRKTISLVIPILNEEGNIERLYETVNSVVAPLRERYEFEFVFTDNHSTDRSIEILRNLATRDSQVRVLRFSRNFGFQRSILTGFLNATGDAAIQLDCDLQDPPALIVKFLEEWQNGAHVVYGVRRRRREGGLITFARKAFYRLINFLSEHPIPVDAGDFRLLDRRIIEELRLLDDANPYLRGTVAGLGFRQVGIPYDRDARVAGESKFNFNELQKLAFDGILNHSTKPLRLATYCSLAIFLAVLIVIGVYCVARFTVGADWPAGFTTLTVLVLISTGLNALFFGIMGEYIGRIYRQVKRTPLTIVEESHNALAEEPAVLSLERIQRCPEPMALERIQRCQEPMALELS